MGFTTVFGSLSKYEKGTMEIINDNPKYYVFFNVFEVAAKASRTRRWPSRRTWST